MKAINVLLVALLVGCGVLAGWSVGRIEARSRVQSLEAQLEAASAAVAVESDAVAEAMLLMRERELQQRQRLHNERIQAERQLAHDMANNRRR